MALLTSQRKSTNSQNMGFSQTRLLAAISVLFMLCVTTWFLFTYQNFKQTEVQYEAPTTTPTVATTLTFDFSTQEGRLKALEQYIYLHNEIGRLNWLPLDMNFGYTRGYSIARYAVDKVFLPMLLEKGMVQGPTCLDWSTRYIGHVYKSVCTDPWAIYYEKNECGGKFGRFTKDRHGFCADIHQTAGIIPDNMFNMVLATMVFEHLHHPPQAAVNIYNMLKPGGVFIFIAPQISIYHEIPDNFYSFTVQGAMLLLREAGFCIKYAHGITSSFACASHILGMAVEDMDLELLFSSTDDIASCLIGIVAIKPEKPGETCPPGDYPTVSELGKYRADWGKRVRQESKPVKQTVQLNSTRRIFA
eukprot:TRINITY_DN749_c1_g1_i3.p2 TRINITY_DN749_c1_g1~~TRINITY_DN749_c1_g1_i3.p2  ORF type:complete len:360 (-),score=34.58 TRINITY_DN749_c1_g1_i3:690-1769(-)